MTQKTHLVWPERVLMEVPVATLVVGGGQEAGVGSEGQVGDAVGVAGEVAEEGEGGGGGVEGVDVDGLVHRGRGEKAAVGGEFDGGDGALVACEGLDEFVGRSRLWRGGRGRHR
uniref:Uncharacterized protein n=1 Tax=Kalanchoe fedtschenkoi TaxID=63787 RepID=A0A7N0ZSF4_KALFE